MATPTQRNDAAAPAPDQGQGARSENLLPGDVETDDGRFDVAEEVNLDQQSESVRRIGQASPDPVPDMTNPRSDPESSIGQASPDPVDELSPKPWSPNKLR
jgi:hypothetical protein